MDTLGNVIDKMLTVNLKSFYGLDNPDIDKQQNLKQQRESLSREADDLAVGILTNQIDQKDAMRPQHKTY
jgi:hypothetical protein